MKHVPQISDLWTLASHPWWPCGVAVDVCCVEVVAQREDCPLRFIPLQHPSSGFSFRTSNTAIRHPMAASLTSTWPGIQFPRQTALSRTACSACRFQKVDIEPSCWRARSLLIPRLPPDQVFQIPAGMHALCQAAIALLLPRASKQKAAQHTTCSEWQLSDSEVSVTRKCHGRTGYS